MASASLSQPAVSRHLRILRESGFAGVRVDGARRIYSVLPQPFSEIDQWLDRYGRLWSNALDALETELARGKRATRAVDDYPTEGDQ